MIPIIYENATQSSIISGNFNTVHLILDGRVESKLEWNEAIQIAKAYVAKGYRIFWELECGLFSQLPHPLASQNQFFSLTLSLDHFLDHVWKEFAKHSVGVCIYKGSIDFSHQFPWDDQQRANFSAWLNDHKLNDESQIKRLTSLYCRNAATDYLTLLANHLPDAVPTYVMLDGKNIIDLEILTQLVSPSFYFPLHQIVKDIPFHLSNTLGWKTPSPHGYIGNLFLETPLPSIAVGVCMPSSESISLEIIEELPQVLSQLVTNNIAFKVIAEENLVAEWDQLDCLIVCSKGVTPSGLRKLKGFCAAGGKIMTLGSPLDLPTEVLWSFSTDLVEAVKNESI